MIILLELWVVGMLQRVYECPWDGRLTMRERRQGELREARCGYYWLLGDEARVTKKRELGT